MSVDAVVPTASLFVRQLSAQTQPKRSAPLIVVSPQADGTVDSATTDYMLGTLTVLLSDGGERNNQRKNLDGERQGETYIITAIGKC